MFEGFFDFSIELFYSVCVDSEEDLLFWQDQCNIEFIFIRFALIGSSKVATELALLRLQSAGLPWLRSMRIE